VRFRGWELSRVRRRRRTGRWATIGFVGGIAVGLVLWSLQMKRSRKELFSPSPMKRLAAMGYLGGVASLENVQLLTEYCRWEPNPMLQKRASRLLKAMKARLV
jgi:hypothetical protein